MLVEGFFFFFGCSFRGKEERGGRRGSSYVDFMLCFFIHTFFSLFPLFSFHFVFVVLFLSVRFVSFRGIEKKKEQQQMSFLYPNIIHSF